MIEITRDNIVKRMTTAVVKLGEESPDIYEIKEVLIDGMIEIEKLREEIRLLRDDNTRLFASSRGTLEGDQL